MTDKEFNKLDKYYSKLVKKGSIKTMNDAYIYKLAIEKAIEVIHCCETLKIKDLMTFEDYKNNLFVKVDGVYQPKKSKVFRWYSEKQLKKMYNNETL